MYSFVESLRARMLGIEMEIGCKLKSGMKRVTYVCLAFTSLLLQCYFLLLLQKQSVYIRKLHEAQPEGTFFEFLNLNGLDMAATSVEFNNTRNFGLH